MVHTTALYNRKSVSQTTLMALLPARADGKISKIITTIKKKYKNSNTNRNGICKLEIEKNKYRCKLNKKKKKKANSKNSKNADCCIQATS